MIMRIIRYYLIFLALSILCLSSCNRNLAIGGKKGKEKSSFDIAAYNYIYVEALKQKLLGNGGDALKYLEQCLKMNPQSDAAYYQMAQIVLANGDIKNGKLYAGKALSLDQNNIWYLTMLAGLYYQEKNLDSAIIYYEKAVKEFPDKLNLQLTLGNLYSENKNYEKAGLIFDSFDNKYGINETSTVSAVKNLMASGKFDDALAKIIVLLKESPDEI